MTTTLPTRCPAPVAPLSPRGSRGTGTFFNADNRDISLPIDNRFSSRSGGGCFSTASRCSWGGSRGVPAYPLDDVALHRCIGIAKGTAVEGNWPESWTSSG